jgi:hypothetical protein
MNAPPNQVVIDHFTIQRRPSDSGPYTVLYLEVAGVRYSMYVSPKGKRVRFYGPRGELK